MLRLSKDWILPPRHNGHPAWRPMTSDIRLAAINDIFFRKCQLDSGLVTDIVKFISHNSAKVDNGRIIIGRGFGEIFISLFPHTHGGYAKSIYQFAGLQGNEEDIAIINEVSNSKYQCDFTLMNVIREFTGWKYENLVANMMEYDVIKSKMNVKARLNYSLKPLHVQKPISANDIEAVQKACKLFFPVFCGFKDECLYLYFSEGNEIAFANVKYVNSAGDVFWLPCSKWIGEEGAVTYDSLAFHLRTLPYNYKVSLSEGSNKDWVVICTNEDSVSQISFQYDNFIKEVQTISCYSPETTDFRFLHGKKAIIFPDNSKDGFMKAFGLYRAIRKMNCVIYFGRRDHPDERLQADLVAITRASSSTSGILTLPQFVEHAISKFDIQPPDDIYFPPEEISKWANKAEENPPETLIQDILCLSYIIMIHAYRGTGKSMLAAFIGVCLRTGTKAFCGLICPSRQYKVLLIDAEMPERIIGKRNRRIYAGLGLILDKSNTILGYAARGQNEKFNLENEQNIARLWPAIMEADVIIFDGVFQLFPSVMSSSYENAKPFLDFVARLRKYERTAIFIDHQGKNKKDAFGTMAKEQTLEAVLSLQKTKTGKKLALTKARDRDETDNLVTFNLVDGSEGELVFEIVEPQEEKMERAGSSSNQHDAIAAGSYTRKSKYDRNLQEQTIIDFCRENPQAKRDVICKHLDERKLGKRSTINTIITELDKAGKLPFWSRSEYQTEKVLQ